MSFVKVFKKAFIKNRAKKPHYVKLKGGISVKSSTKHENKCSMVDEKSVS